jgi:hypothetical protein
MPDWGVARYHRGATAYVFSHPPVIGAIAAVVLYMIFAGHLVQGDLFPKIDCQDKSKCTGGLGSLLIAFFGPVEPPDFAKVVVWSFIAGFSERLVPNMLDALSKTTLPRSN